MTKLATIQHKLKAEIEAEKYTKEDLFERYKRMLASGTAASYYVIRAADTDKLADQAVRHHIAQLIDEGRDGELTMQLRAYAVKYLVSPSEIMRKRE
jgi:hypothetical protein